MSDKPQDEERLLEIIQNQPEVRQVAPEPPDPVQQHLALLEKIRHQVKILNQTAEGLIDYVHQLTALAGENEMRVGESTRSVVGAKQAKEATGFVQGSVCPQCAGSFPPGMVVECTIVTCPLKHRWAKDRTKKED